MSVKEALKLTADVQTKQFTPPPRSIVDITAILDEAEAVDLSSISKLNRQVDTAPPSSGHEADLADFYHRRADAALALGQHLQALEDSRKAASYVPEIRRSGIRELSTGGPVRPAVYIARRAKMEAIFGNYRKAKGLVESGLAEARLIEKRGAGQVLKFTNDAISIYGRTGDIAAIEAVVSKAQDAFDAFESGKRGAFRKGLQVRIWRATWNGEILE
ncbi:MAG: hypothetical protein HOK54_19005 [Alphaproteobacteria bacterium]|nr:hypothetical protein [Alphaproteobacteria bacterium]